MSLVLLGMTLNPPSVISHKEVTESDAMNSLAWAMMVIG
jgi:hypothetical protein